jgi:hypothetical protein
LSNPILPNVWPGLGALGLLERLGTATMLKKIVLAGAVAISVLGAALATTSAQAAPMKKHHHVVVHHHHHYVVHHHHHHM